MAARPGAVGTAAARTRGGSARGALLGYAGPPRRGRIASRRRCRRQGRPARVVDGHLAAGRAGSGRTERSAGMIRVRHLPLPTGLNAFVRKGADGDMEVFVSDGLDPGRARAAVRLALRSFGPAGRTAGLLPIPVVLLLAGGRSWLRALLHAVRTHLVASAATAASVAVATSAVVVVALPQQHHPAAASRGPAPSHVQAPAPRPGTTTAGPQPVSGGSAGPAPGARSSGQAPAGLLTRRHRPRTRPPQRPAPPRRRSRLGHRHPRRHHRPPLPRLAAAAAAGPASCCWV